MKFRISLILISIITIVFSGCQEEVTDLENTVENSNLNSWKNSINNPYDHYGSDFIVKLQDINNWVFKNKNKYSSFNNFKNDNNNKFSNYFKTIDPNDFNEIEDSLIVELKSNFIFDYKYFENKEKSVLNNGNLSASNVKNYLKVVSRLKYTSYYLNNEVDDENYPGEQAVSEFENCLVGCVSDEIDDYNPVDWLAFATNPPAATAWQVASCAWDCA